MGYYYACGATGGWGASDEQQAALAACFGNALAAELRVATVGRGRAHEYWGVHTAPAPRREARIGRPAGVAAAHVRALPTTGNSALSCQRRAAHDNSHRGERWRRRCVEDAPSSMSASVIGLWLCLASHTVKRKVCDNEHARLSGCGRLAPPHPPCARAICFSLLVLPMRAK